MPVRRRSRLPHILITPTIIVLIAALGYPVAWQIITSFKEFGLRQQFGVPADWVGLANYVEIVSDPALWAIVLRSLVFCLVVSFATVLIGGALAGLMNSVHKAARLTLQVALLLAWAMPAVASMTVWIWLVDWRRGLLNWALVRLGVDAQGHNWLADPTSFLIIAAIIVTWMSVPFVTLSIYAGLTQVSPEVLEAAKIDGASGIQRLRHIIVPLIAPVLSIVLLLQFIWNLRVFTQVKILQDAGGVANETHLLGTYIYQLGTGKGDFGSASAVSILMLLLTIAISWRYVRNLMKEES
ncbi:MAG: sugar ABC transporter permease [Actinomycetales bacterium]|jgi:N,N'-diacetylchitobiose transport system permease protein|uniref:Sugar ABC transporter permease n=1 Tax=Candidatus Phosphoribacter hodrii TaxID=2953743 RepID=A0A934X7C7_9MICO|nr:sugar ABC transporter permease [Candidatus Phosphoribacter hodrii]MBP8837358.1 sugar ABC transporter permease [Dermatophilaceae bacterium]OPZ56133.1 MAG: Inner membrane ABC transporter permease protein YcjO [bacterium ADurb.BinA028]MBK7274001.1 sugar ABC transporter permease [Candidatus Phosphoribacter hodrii]MBL0004319.1 sugar ABC transporter permease [Candidatus Phosphoribacter hodrii]